MQLAESAHRRRGRHSTGRRERACRGLSVHRRYHGPLSERATRGSRRRYRRSRRSSPRARNAELEPARPRLILVPVPGTGTSSGKSLVLRGVAEAGTPASHERTRAWHRYASLELLREHPAMAFEILGSVLALSDSRVVLELRQDRRACRLRTRVMRVDVVDRDIQAVDYERRLTPGACLLAHFGVMLRALV